jgi:hypothetical protein
MSQDVKFFVACDHLVDNRIYNNDECPRCYGKGYYLDIHFDNSGQAVLTTGSLKLQQEILKVIMDEKYKNVFHPLWGSELHDLPGSKNLRITRVKIEMAVRSAIEYLKNVQLAEYAEFKNLTTEEILDQILYIEVTPLGPTGYSVNVVISNSVGELMSQTITI